MTKITALMNNCKETDEYINDFNKRFNENNVLKRIAFGLAKKEKNKIPKRIVVSFELSFIFPKLSIPGFYMMFISGVLLLFFKWKIIYVPIIIGFILGFILVLSDILFTRWFFGKMLKKGVSRSSYGKAGFYVYVLNYDELAEVFI